MWCCSCKLLGEAYGTCGSFPGAHTDVPQGDVTRHGKHGKQQRTVCLGALDPTHLAFWMHLHVVLHPFFKVCCRASRASPRKGCGHIVTLQGMVPLLGADFYCTSNYAAYSIRSCPLVLVMVSSPKCTALYWRARKWYIPSRVVGWWEKFSSSSLPPPPPQIL